jgi:hypothetical protein
MQSRCSEMENTTVGIGFDCELSATQAVVEIERATGIRTVLVTHSLYKSETPLSLIMK